MERLMLDAAGLRAAVRAGDHTGPTAGLAPGFTQANLVALPEADAFDFLRFCVANPKPCPVLDVSDPGSPEPARIATGADLRTDVPRYRIWRDGELVDEPTDASEHWRDDLVAFLIGCSFTFERALEAEGLPIRHVEQGVNVPMYRTSVDCAPADCPPRVTSAGFPPNAAMLSRTHASAASWSAMPRLGGIPGALRKPRAPRR